MTARPTSSGKYSYFLGEILEQVARVEYQDLPKMLKPIDLEDMQRILLALAERFKRIIPE